MTLNIKTREQHLGDLVRRIKNNSRISNFAPGGDLITILEAIASRAFKTELAVLKILEQTNIDNLTGSNLDLAAEAVSLSNGIGGVGRRPSARATGTVTIGSGFDKISTLPYVGKPAPFRGSSKLYLQDCSLFADPGTSPELYIGRGTDRFEGPIAYTAMTNTGSYWELTLSTALTLDHTYTDTVILAQGGDRTIPSGMQVNIPAKSNSKQVSYTVDATTVLADGEAEVDVTVTCTEYGIAGNASVGAITDISALPFSGATCTNESVFSSGSDSESDASLRQRIKDLPDTLSRGTTTAIKSSLLGAQDTIEQKTIVSTNAITAVESTDPTVIYVDDGSVLEPIFASQTYELLVAGATGREKSFRTAQAPVTPLMLVGKEYGPFALEDGLTLTLVRDGETSTYTIDSAQYVDVTNASVYEVIRDLNSQPGDWEFRVFDNGRRIVAFDKDDSGEIGYAVASDAQEILGLSISETRNLYLYRNGVVQSFKGITASLTTRLFSEWELSSYSSNGFLNGVVVVDGVTVSNIDITNADFAQFGSTFATSTVDQWRQVFEQKIPGISAEVSDGRIVMSSNLTNDSRSSLVVTPGPGTDDWVYANAVWEPTGTLSSSGRTRNYKFNRRTGDIRFVDDLTAGDIIEIATEYTRGHVESATATSGTFDVTGSTQWGGSKMVVAFDSPVTIRTVFPASTSTITVACHATSAYGVVRLTDTDLDGFLTEIEVGDWVWFNLDLDSNPAVFTTYDEGSVNGLYRVIRRYIDPNAGANPNDYVGWIEIEVSANQRLGWKDIQDTAASSKFVCSDGSIQAFLCARVPQVVDFTGQTVMTVQAMADFISDRIVGGSVYLLTGQIASLRTNTFADGGSAAVCAIIDKVGDVWTASDNDSTLSHTAESSSDFAYGASPIVQNVYRSGELMATGELPTTSSYTSATLAAAAYTNRSFIRSELTFTEADVAMSSRPVIQAASSVTVYPTGTQEYFLTGRYSGLSAQVFNTNTVAPFIGFMMRDVTTITGQTNNDILEKSRPGMFSVPTKDRISHFSVRLEDLPLSASSILVIRADNDAVNKNVTVPLYKSAEIATITAITAGGKGQVIQFTLKDPEDLTIPGDLTSGRTFFNTFSSFKAFSFEGFNLLTKSVGIYNRDPSGPSTDALVLRSADYGGNSKLKFMLQFSGEQNTPISCSHSCVFDPGNDMPNLFITVSLPSAATLASMATGTYSFTVGAATDNVYSCVLSSYTAATKAQKASGAPGITYLATTAGAAGNSIIVNVTDSGVGGLDIVATYATLTVDIDLGGTTGAIASLKAFDTTAGSFVVGQSYIIKSVGSTDFTLVGAADNNVGTEFVATGVGAGTGKAKPGLIEFTGSSGQLEATQASVELHGRYYPAPSGVFAVAIPVGSAGNGIRVQQVSVGGALDIYETADIVVIDLGGTYRTRSDLSAFMPAPTMVTFSGTASNEIGVPDMLTLSGGIDGATASVTLSGGVDASSGAIGAFSDTNHILVIGGSGSALPVGAWKVASIPSAGAVEILVPGYTGLATVASVSAIAYPLSNIEIASATLDDIETVIESYASTFDIASATAIGAGAGTLDINEATYETHANAASLPTAIATPTDALRFHAFSCNLCGKATVTLCDPNTLGVMQAVVQTTDSIWPTTTQASGTSYTPVGESVIIVPSNTRTLASWCGFSVNSALSTYIDTSRTLDGAVVQLSSNEAGGEKAIYAQQTYANATSIVPQDAAVEDDDVLKVEVRSAEAQEFTRHSLVKVVNAVESEIYRPWRHIPSGSSITVANTTTQNTWVRSTNRWMYWRDPVTTTKVRLILCRAGQFTGSGSESLAATDTIVFTSLGNGLVQVTHSAAGGGALSARVGDMMWIPSAGGTGAGSPFYSDQRCAAMGTCDFGSNKHNAGRGTGDTGMVYPGYQVLEVIDSSNIIIFAPHMTSFGAPNTVTITNAKDMVFIPSLWNEKNLLLNQNYGSKYHVSTSKAVTAVVKVLGRGICALVVSNTATGSPIGVPTYASDDLKLNANAVNTNDWIYLCGGTQGFAVANQGWHRIVAHDGKSTIFFYNESGGQDELLQDVDVGSSGTYGALNWGIAGQAGAGLSVSESANPSELRPIRVVDQDSVMVGHKIRISVAAAGTTWLDANLVGTWTVTDMGWINDFTGLVTSNAAGEQMLSPWVEFSVQSVPAASASIADNSVTEFGSNANGLGFVEGDPFTGFKAVDGWALSESDSDIANLYLSPQFNSHLISPDLGTELEVLFKVGLPIENRAGIDGYQIFSGLIQEAHRIIDGMPSNLAQYEGIKAAGTVISVMPPIPRPVQVVLSIAPKAGVALSILADMVRSVLSTYFVGLGVGKPAIESEMIAVVQGVAGVSSVAIESTIPALQDGQIVVSENEKIVVISPSSDIAIG